MELRTGDIIEMTEPTPDETGSERFRVLELRGDRVLVEFICDLPIPPTYVFPRTDIRLSNAKVPIVP